MHRNSTNTVLIDGFLNQICKLIWLMEPSERINLFIWLLQGLRRNWKWAINPIVFTSPVNSSPNSPLNGLLNLKINWGFFRPRRFGRLCTLIFCRGRRDVQIVKLTCRAFSLYCEHNCAIDLRHSSNFRVSILSSSDQTLIFFPTRNWTNVRIPTDS